MADFQFAVLDFIQNHLRTPVGDAAMPIITRLGNGGILWVATGFLLLVSRKHRKTGVMVLAALAIEYLLCNVWLKNAVAAARPCDLNQSVQLLIARPRDYSFPSGHTGASFAAVTALYLGKERYWYLALIPAVLIAFSRMRHCGGGGQRFSGLWLCPSFFFLVWKTGAIRSMMVKGKAKGRWNAAEKTDVPV